MKLWRPIAIGALALISILTLAAFRPAPAVSFSDPLRQGTMISSSAPNTSVPVLMTNVVQHPPQDCLSVPKPIRDLRTGQLVTFNEDATYRAWMMAFSCRAASFSHGADFAIVWLTAKAQCQTVILGKPYLATYIDAGGNIETIWTKTGLTILQEDKIMYTTSASTTQLCPEQVLTLRSPLMNGENTYLALFSLALPDGGFDGSHLY